MNRIQCFWTEPADTAVESLRRYANTGPGVHDHFHNASVDIGEVPWTERNNGRGDLVPDSEKADPRWPKECVCGYEFKPTDVWQHNFHRHFRRVDTGEKFLLGDPPVGAMYDATWYPPGFGKGADGRSLIVVLPDGHPWHVDGKASNGPGWIRTGEVPRVTAQPSILTDGYHGFLRDGWLEEC